MCSPDPWVGSEKDQPLDQTIWHRIKDAGKELIIDLIYYCCRSLLVDLDLLGQFISLNSTTDPEERSLLRSSVVSARL